MTDTPSLALLKGQNSDAPVQEDVGNDGPIDAVEDIKKASAKALEVLLKDNDTTPPAGWSSLSLADKRAWVLAKFEADNAEENAATDVGDDATVGQAAAPEKPAKAAKGKGKKSKGEPVTVEAIADASGGLPVEQDQVTDATDAPGSAEAPPFDPDPPAPVSHEVTDEAEQIAKAKSKGKVKKKGQEVALAAKEGEILPADPIKDIVHEVENMDKKTALELVVELNEQADIAFFRLGGILSLVSSNGWWQTEDNKYPTFRAYIEQEHGLEYRKATYWIAIYNALAKSPTSPGRRSRQSAGPS